MSVAGYMHTLSSGGGNPSVHRIIMYFTSQPPISMNMTCTICTWHAHDMHMICTWHVHDMYMICTWHAHDIHMICSLLTLTTRNLRALKTRNWEIIWGKVSRFMMSWEGQLLQATAVYTVMLHCFACIKPCTCANYMQIHAHCDLQFVAVHSAHR